MTNQIEFSPCQMQHLDTGVLEQCQLNRCSPMAWSCLGGGQLFNQNDEKSQRLLRILTEVGDEIGTDIIEAVVYAWIMALPSNIAPILGSSRLERVAQATTAMNLSLSQEQWYRIWQASTGHPVP